VADIDYMSKNNNDCEIEDSEGNKQRAILVATPGGFSQPTLSHDQAVVMGLVPGHSWVSKFGVNHDVLVAGLPEDVWEFGGPYIYDADGTAPIVSLVSTVVGDTQTIDITGLNGDGNEVVQHITLTGNVRVALDIPLWRVYRMENDSAVDIAGILYCYTGLGNTPNAPEIRALIEGSHNKTLMTLYTIPKGKVGFFKRAEVGMQFTKGGTPSHEFAHLHVETRDLGKVFKVQKSVTLLANGDSNYKDVRPFPDPVSSFTDIRTRVIEVSTDMGVWATFDIELIDETLFPLEYLQAIGQPGY
jgi:hypothetical protein